MFVFNPFLIVSMISKLRLNNEEKEIPEDESRTHLWINLEQFHINILKSQYDCIFKIMNHVSEYRRFQFNYYETRKFHYFRPEIGGLLMISKDKDKENPNARKMWRYGIRIALKKIKYLRGEYNI